MTDEKAAAILERLYYLFGRGAVFIRVLYGTKKAVGKWKGITWKQTQIPKYRAELLAAIKAGGNIAVVLGPPSGGICAIDCDLDEEWRPFLAENPDLAACLRTRSAHGGQVFFLMKPGAVYPNSQAAYRYYAKGRKEHIGEWRCGGGGKGAYSIIYGWQKPEVSGQPEGVHYTFEVETPIAPLEEFGSIKWRPKWECPWSGSAPPGKPPGGAADERFIPSKEFQKIPEWVYPPKGGIPRFEGDDSELRWEDPVPSPEDVYDKRTGEFQKAAPRESGPPSQPEWEAQADQAAADADEFLEKRIQLYLDKCDPAISGQGGHNTTFRVTCVLVRGFSLGKAEALKWLRYYNRKCEPPWSEKELEHKVEDALKAPHEKPPGYLLNDGEANNSGQADQTATEATATAGGRVDWNAVSASSQTREQFKQPAIYPKDSILEEYVQYGISQTEGVEAYILGSVLPVAAALIGRRVYFRLPLKIYPNLFVMLAGAAGDRKSSTIKIAEELAKGSVLLPPEAFIPLSFSPETLFDEYDTRPDKLWIVDDANIVLTDWNKTANGERVGARFLSLYDCCELSESFRRNKTRTSGPRRSINETSTSLLFGATFNAACFQGQGEQIRKGMSRRFLFYVGDGHGRTHTRPQWKNIGNVANIFKQLMVYLGEIKLAEESEKIWDEYQYRNRELKDRADRFDDAERARLNSAPTHVMKIATIFELACAAKQNPMTPAEVNSRLAAGIEPPPIRLDTLELAIAHVDEGLKAARFLDKIADQAVVAAQAEVLIAKIRNNFGGKQKGETILLSRTVLTDKYAHNPDRQGSVTPDDLYLRIIPELIAQGIAKIHSKSGKLEMYAFKKE